MAAGTWANNAEQLVAELPIPVLLEALRADGCDHLHPGPYCKEIRDHAPEHPDAVVAAAVALLRDRYETITRLAARAEAAELRLAAAVDACAAVVAAVPAQGTLL